MDPELASDLLDRDTGLPATGDLHHVITELASVRLRHSDILLGRPAGKPDQVSPIRAAGPGGIGTLLLPLFAGLHGDVEREVLVERTMSGLAAARARGRVGGRPTVVPTAKVAAARALIAAGTPRQRL